MGRSDREFCYVRWLHSVRAVAQAEQRPLSAEECRGPFPMFRWARQPENRPVGHPPAGGPHYGAAETSEVLYAAPLMIGLGALPGSADPLFRLNLDICGPCNFPRPNGARFSLVRSLLLYFALCIPDIIIQNENQKVFSSGRSACSSTQHAHHPCPGYGT